MNIKDLTGQESHDMWNSLLLKENRALDMELMETYERIRDLENQVAFLKKTVGIMEKMDKI
jgi:hypothetical protein